jgi:hypothetical protein
MDFDRGVSAQVKQNEIYLLLCSNQSASFHR